MKIIAEIGCNHITKAKGGDGVIREVFELWNNHNT